MLNLRTHFQNAELCKSVESKTGAPSLGSGFLLLLFRFNAGDTPSTLLTFPAPANRTGRADFPHPVLGQNITPSPTTHRDPIALNVRTQNARRDETGEKPQV